MSKLFRYVGVRWDSRGDVLECWCTRRMIKTLHNVSDCTIACPSNEDLACGGIGPEPNVNIYCLDIHRVDNGKVDDRGMDVAFIKVPTTAKWVEVVLAVLTIVMITLSISVGILCHQRGLDTYSKYNG